VSLREYKTRRDFSHTPEPDHPASGIKARPAASAKSGIGNPKRHQNRNILEKGEGQNKLAPRRLRSIPAAKQREGTYGKAHPAGLLASVAELLQSLPAAQPGFIEPMKARLTDTLPKGAEWTYEVKFDGVRVLAIKDGASLRLSSRKGNDLSAPYPEVFEALRKLPADRAVLDGEVVALDPQGRSSFQLLQSYHKAVSEKPPLVYYVFDLLHLECRDLRGVPLWRRKELAQLIVNDLCPTIRFSASIDADSTRLIREMRARGLEGLIAKQKDSGYESGRRSGCWVKFKWTNEQEFVIGGYTPPKGTRSYFGALLVGYFEDGELLFAGKVGTGFDERLLKTLHQRFQPLIRARSPFVNLPDRLGSGRGLGRSELRECTWLEPRLICQIRFAEWTRDQRLRQPTFLGLREDKDPSEVVRETAT